MALSIEERQWRRGNIGEARGRDGKMTERWIKSGCR
jgi:hypothetical protein